MSIKNINLTHSLNIYKLMLTLSEIFSRFPSSTPHYVILCIVGGILIHFPLVHPDPLFLILNDLSYFCNRNTFGLIKKFSKPLLLLPRTGDQEPAGGLGIG